MSEELKSAREFVRSLEVVFEISEIESLVRKIEARDKLIEEAARRRAGEPWLFAIEQIDNGTWKDGEQCVFGDLVSAQDEVDLLNDAFPEGDDPYRVVPLFRFAISAPGALAGRPNVVGAKPVCFDCSAAGIINCSHFDNCAGKWVYKASAEHDREIERKARQPLIEALQHVLAIDHFTNLDSVKYGDKSIRTIIEEIARGTQ